MKDRWFANFERNLAENGYFDHPERDDLYEQAAKDAFDQLRNEEPHDHDNDD